MARHAPSTLTYAASERCRCGAGLAIDPASPSDHPIWRCGDVLTGVSDPDRSIHRSSRLRPILPETGARTTRPHVSC